MLKKILTILTFLSFSCVASAETQLLPKPRGTFVIDEAGIIDAAAKETINQLSQALLKEKKVPLYVVTIPSLAQYDAGEYSVDEYTRMIFDHWGIGWQDRNYGILLLVSKGDRKARIEFGADWNHRYDREASHIMNSIMIPRFKNRDYSRGILLGAQALDSTARGLDLPNNMKQIPMWAVILIALGMVALIVSLFKSGKKGWAWALIVALALFLWFVLRRSASGGLGGGSGGGGGSSGSW
jgi:uncharacterized protein